MSFKGLFLGMTTIDLIYLLEEQPLVNQKVNSKTTTYAAGGPATNAAVIFSEMGAESVLCSEIGQHPLSELIKSDLSQHHVILRDLLPELQEVPPFSSIMVQEKTGHRSIVSAPPIQHKTKSSSFPMEDILEFDVVLFDGHQMQASFEVSQETREHGIPTVMDCGSWKSGTGKILKNVDYVICSENFLPPDCHQINETIEYLKQNGVASFAITQGANSIIYCDETEIGELKITEIDALDTMGAGDFFHGAFAFYICQTNGDFIQSLEKASEVATFSCQFFGSREWLTKWKNQTIPV